MLRITIFLPLGDAQKSNGRNMFCTSYNENTQVFDCDFPQCRRGTINGLNAMIAGENIADYGNNADEI